MKEFIKMAFLQIYFMIERIATKHHQNADDEPFDPEWMDFKAWAETRM